MQDHYFSAEQTIRSNEKIVSLTLPDLSLPFYTDSGVFSMDRIDPGTKLLLLEAPHPQHNSQNIVDVGCGYGPIGATLAKRCPETSVYAVDTNTRALELCIKNAENLGITNMYPYRTMVDSPSQLDSFPNDAQTISLSSPPSLHDIHSNQQIDAIYSNPPIRIGKTQLHALLLFWMKGLKQDGLAWWVVQKHLGADTLQNWLTSQGYPTTRFTSRGGYRILHSIKSQASE